MGRFSPARLQLTLTTQHNTPTMDPSRVWYDIPITRINEPTSNTKRVRWSDKLTQVKTISPRYKAIPFSWPQPRQKTCNHFVCTAGESCKMFGKYSVSQDQGLAFNNTNNNRSNVNTDSFNCSPQLKKVVIKAVNNNNNNYWKPDKKELSLNLGNNYWSNSTS